VKDEREDAEKRCADQIGDALVEKLENPGFWEKAGNLLGDAVDAADKRVDDNADILKKISGALKVVSAVAGVLSFIPILAPVFGPIALATGGVALLIDSVLVATGNGDWKAMAVDTALMALPGVGKLVKVGVKSARSARGARVVAKGVTGSDRAADVAKAAPRPKPEWLKRLTRGNQFNKDR